MANQILTVVFKKAEQKLDTVIAAAVNELHSLGHIVTEVRVMGDSGEAKVALNQVEGIIDQDGTELVADAKTDLAAIEPADTVDNKGPDGKSPVSPLASTTGDAATAGTAGLPVDGGTPTLSLDERRKAALEELDAIEAEEEAQEAGSTSTATDPTSSSAGTSTPVTGS